MRAHEFINQQTVNEIAPVVSTLAQGAGQTVKKVGQMAGQAAGAVADKVTGQQQTTPQPAGNIKTVGSVGTQQQQAAQQPVPQIAQKTPDQAAQNSAQQKQMATQQQQQQQQQAAQSRQQTLTNLDKIAAQLVALKQNITKQQP